MSTETAATTDSVRLVPVTLANARLGLTVSRGPDWHWGDQDGRSFGVIERIVQPGAMGEGQGMREDAVLVRWAANGTYNQYRIGVEGQPHRACDLVIGTTPMVDIKSVVHPPEVQSALDARKGQPVTLALAPRGTIVSPGPDWCWANQNEGCYGWIARVHSAQSMCIVQWQDGHEGNYRAVTGPDSYQELVYGDVRTPHASEDAAPSSKRKARWLAGRMVCAEIAARGLMVARGPDWFQHHSTGAGGNGFISRITPDKKNVVVVWEKSHVPASMHRIFNPDAGSYAADLLFGREHFVEKPMPASRPLPRGIKPGDLVTQKNFRRGAPATCGAAFPFRWPNVQMTLLRVDCWDDEDVHMHKIVLRATDGREATAKWGEVIFGDVRPDMFAPPPPITCPETLARLEQLAGKPVTRDCAPVGAVVSRGYRWKYRDQDKGKRGWIICADAGQGFLTVRWDHEDSGNYYRVPMGRVPGETDEAFHERGLHDSDLIYGAVPPPPIVCPDEAAAVARSGKVVSLQNFHRGAAVRPGPGWTSRERPPGLGRLIIPLPSMKRVVVRWFDDRDTALLVLVTDDDITNLGELMYADAVAATPAVAVAEALEAEGDAVEAWTCPICLDRYNRQSRMPLVLPCCGHSICAECWARMAAKGSRDGEDDGGDPIVCPLDRQKLERRRPPPNRALMAVLPRTEAKASDSASTADA